ncbi:MAG: hypothetical protein A4E65_03094 [Syntrophorhabdus sp. PtaU1.Bin153]|nr:MAG: hypothetical protein A4E65_03094 [Syntrophorhabdus sp. PtaU1.Bin153]
MNKDTYEEARKASREIEDLLKAGNLTPEEETKLRTAYSQLAGVLMSPWFPADWGRRAIMLLLFILGSYGLTDGHHLFLILYALCLLFSPRTVGELAMLYGRLVRK